MNDETTNTETDAKAKRLEALRDSYRVYSEGWDTAAVIHAKYGKCPETPSVEDYAQYAYRWAEFEHGWKCSLVHIKKWNL